MMASKNENHLSLDKIVNHSNTAEMVVLVFDKLRMESSKNSDKTRSLSADDCFNIICRSKLPAPSVFGIANEGDAYIPRTF